ncbi:acyltransferase [Dyadobacter sp. LHD-138]|uniref:acyltransferase family protein n=1 Tax=Dyadobacter sp. LHD-138 TaxID=3071413 RepID=UPI0027E165D7|nr:acyltransferase [Dyadobacter sp. LHD-138]MDQ6477293.1 acyltransferase [Dyadobacter sp. LHD-138]
MRQRVEQLDGLRGIFSILVIAHHHNAFRDSIFYNNFFVINSSLFVDFFFVLSGFVIAMNYVEKLNSTESFISFIKKRFIRLYPLLFFTEVLFIVANLIGNQSTLKNATDLPLFYYLQSGLDTLTFMGSTPILGDWMGINYPAWSISSEMISYVVFGIVLVLLPAKKYWVFALISVACVGFIVFKDEYMLVYDYGFIRGLLCFCMGIFTFALLREKSFTLTLYEIPYLILLVGAMYATHHYEWNLIRLIFPVLFALGIIIFASSSGIVTKLLSSKPFQYLGRISYSIYLNHAIVLIFVNICLFRVLKWQPTESRIALSLTISIVLTIFYSHFTYEFIEKRFGKFLKNKLG